MEDATTGQPVALVTGVSRSIGIGRAVADRLTSDGFRVITAGLTDYDERMPWGADAAAARSAYEVDFADAEATAALIPEVSAATGPISTLVLCHCESVDSTILTSTVDTFDRHMAVNARATWMLIKGLAEQFEPSSGPGRIVAITSDHTAFNMPYGASKGAMDRIVIAAATELPELGITANVINPGATDTGWMSPEIEEAVMQRNLQPRVGVPGDVANLVGFLCSPEGGWINGQLLYSDGGLRR